MSLARFSNRLGAVFSRQPALRTFARNFSGYDGQDVADHQLIKKSDDWVIEETNFCLGRISYPRFKETDDYARRTLHLMDCQLGKMHTRLRDGTCIPYTAYFLDDVLDKPGPNHCFVELPLLKWTWDETYDEAYEPAEASTETQPVKAAAPKAAAHH